MQSSERNAFQFLNPVKKTLKLIKNSIPELPIQTDFIILSPSHWTWNILKAK